MRIMKIGLRIIKSFVSVLTEELFFWFIFKHFHYTLPVCDLVSNVRTNSVYISASRQHRDFGFSIKDVLFSASRKARCIFEKILVFFILENLLFNKKLLVGLDNFVWLSGSNHMVDY